MGTWLETTSGFIKRAKRVPLVTCPCINISLFLQNQNQPNLTYLVSEPPLCSIPVLTYLPTFGLLICICLLFYFQTHLPPASTTLSNFCQSTHIIILHTDTYKLPIVKKLIHNHKHILHTHFVYFCYTSKVWHYGRYYIFITYMDYKVV